MQLILAIDSDPRRSEQLANLVRSRLQVDLVQATSAGEALHALKDRVPDLILTSPLLSPFDDGVLDEYLRDLGSAATHVQTVRIPMLSTGPRKKSAATRLFTLGRKKQQTSSAAPDGCDPKVFADEIAHYLTRSLEQRTASGRNGAVPASDAAPALEAAPAPLDDAWGQPPADEWDAPAALVEEFRAPLEQTPKLVESAPAIEDRHVPGSILDLRPAPAKSRSGPPSVHAPAPPAVVQREPLFESAQDEATFAEPQPETHVHPEPTYVLPEPRYVKSEPTYARPEPTYVMPEPTYVRPEPTSITPEPVRVEPEPVVATRAARVAPSASVPPAATASGNSASFEAALAAIRAAWAKPESTAPKPGPAALEPEPRQTSAARPTPSPGGSAKPAGGSGEVDLTNQIDALEDIGDGAGLVADADDSPDGSTTTHGRGTVEKPRKRQENPRARKMRGPDGRDQWAAFDPNRTTVR
jgi:hypothetical protein